MNEADGVILDHFRDIRGRTLEMLGVVPDELLARAAKGEEHPLCWQFAHIAGGVNWWMHHVMNDGLGWVDDHPAQKEAMRDGLIASQDRLISFFSADDGEAMGRVFTMSEEKEPEGGLTEWVGRDRVLYLTAHELHHLGRAELALWQFGLTGTPDFP